jgi:hypothetical protein
MDSNPVKSGLEQNHTNQGTDADRDARLRAMAERMGRPELPQEVGDNQKSRRESATEYLFGGTYWAVVLENGVPVPRTVKTGVTDFDYSEVVSGLTLNEQVILLPSSDLFERQDRMQDRIRQRMRMPGMGRPAGN